MKPLELKGKNMKKLLLFLICIIFFSTHANGKEPMQSAQVNITVPILTGKSIRLKNLPANAAVAVEVSADNPVQLFLLNH